jgi:hypothetical protein
MDSQRSESQSPHRQPSSHYFAYHSFDEAPQVESKWMHYWRLIRTRSRYYVPILRWLPKYDVKADLLHDVLAGLTVAMLLIPQSLSYASGLAKLEPAFGLYSCFVPILIYGILGTSRYD